MPLYLAWFTLHPDYHEFRVQELESLASCFGVKKSELWTESLPKYFSWHEERYRSPTPNDHSNSFAWVTLPSDEVALGILERSVLIRGFVDVWSSGKDHETVKAILRMDLNVKREFLDRYLSSDIDFCWKVKSIGKKLSRNEQVSRMNEYGFLFKGTEKVNLSDPKLILGIFEDWRTIDGNGEEVKSISKEDVSRTKADLKRVYVGRVVGIQSCNEVGDKSLWWLKYSLNKRPVLGPTTMDNELAFIMCNIGQVKKDKVVFDPFCGTGGILISASHLGALCFGSDIDLRVINGWFCSYINPHMIKGKTISEDHPKSIFANFDHYKLERPEIIRMDISKSSVRSSWIDAIICDPPYGIRATSRTSANSSTSQLQSCSSSTNTVLISDPAKVRRSGNLAARGGVLTKTQTQDLLDKRIANTNKNQIGSLQPVEEMIQDLILFAQSSLVDSGHLVFLLPLVVSESNMVVSQLLHRWNKSFSIDFPYLQTLGGGLGRLLVHMELRNNEELPNFGTESDKSRLES
ncbi:putative tRNA guanosine-2'-O-methyltransferase [Cryptosporidium felis]|nr:putative tRNA guanosine-2'-O-methyltransferase [Cryptosporidium felis]